MTREFCSIQKLTFRHSFHKFSVEFSLSSYSVFSSVERNVVKLERGWDVVGCLKASLFELNLSHFSHFSQGKTVSTIKSNYSLFYVPFASFSDFCTCFYLDFQRTNDQNWWHISNFQNIKKSFFSFSWKFKIICCCGPAGIFTSFLSFPPTADKSTSSGTWRKMPEN